MRGAIDASVSAMPLDVWHHDEGNGGEESILTFEVRSEAGGTLGLDELRALHTQMREAAIAAGRPERRYLIGRPIALGTGGRAALRIAVGAAAVIDLARAAAETEVQRQLAAAGDDLRGLFARLDCLVALYPLRHGHDHPLV